MASKKGSGLKDCLGILKKDVEWKETKKILDKEWSSWTKKYVSAECFEFIQE